MTNSMICEPQRRKLSDNEIAYHWGARKDGVNDMYIRHTLEAPLEAMAYARAILVWAIILLRHPLLASSIDNLPNGDAEFVYNRPTTVTAAVDVAAQRCLYLPNNRPISSEFMNGPRMLSDEKLVLLRIAHPVEVDLTPGARGTFQLMIMVVHAITDGLAHNLLLNECYTLLGSPHDIEALQAILESELAKPRSLPPSLEDILPGSSRPLQNKLSDVLYANTMSKYAGGQVFPLKSGPKEMGYRRIKFTYTEKETTAILTNCKAHSVSIAHAAFALGNIAWARCSDIPKIPTLFYSAMSLRNDAIPISPPCSYVHMAIGHFLISLPTLFPPSLSVDELFWHRARLAKKHTRAATQSPFKIPFFRAGARARKAGELRKASMIRLDTAAEKGKEPQSSEQANGHDAHTSDESAQSNGLPNGYATDGTPRSPNGSGASHLIAKASGAAPSAPQKALMGMTFLGRIDDAYRTSSYPSIKLGEYGLGARRGPGGSLMSAYTWQGELHIGMGFDANGLDETVIEQFLGQMTSLIQGVLLPEHLGVPRENLPLGSPWIQ